MRAGELGKPVELVLTTENRIFRGSSGEWRSAGAVSLLGDLSAVDVRLIVIGREDPGLSTVSKSSVIAAERVTAVPVLSFEVRSVARLNRWLVDVWRSIGDSDAVVAVVPGQVGPLALAIARLRGKPVGVAVVGDAWDALAPGSTKHPARRLARPIMACLQRVSCRLAYATLYVTQQTLQRRYPPRKGRPTFSATNACITDVAVPRQRLPEAAIRILTVGSMEQPYKGIPDVIRAVEVLRSKGIDACLTVVGDGRLASEIKEFGASRLGASVNFTGQLAPEDVNREYKNADVFVLASHTEGLPRVMVEAMSHALPCVGTSVGGIPELLAPNYLVPARSPEAIASRIAELCCSPKAYLDASRASANRAQEMRDHSPAKERAAFVAAVVQGSGQP